LGQGALDQQVSVEPALNSRCSSDRDRDPTQGHWGRYHPRPLSEAERARVGIAAPVAMLAL